MNYMNYDPFVHYVIGASNGYPQNPYFPVSELMEPAQNTHIWGADGRCCIPCSAGRLPQNEIYPSIQHPPFGFTQFYNLPDAHQIVQTNYPPNNIDYPVPVVENFESKDDIAIWLGFGTNSRIIKWNLFSPDYYAPGMKWNKMQKGFVNDIITDEEIEAWLERPMWESFPVHYQPPVLISAQTGMGKNYFVTHRLREFAKRRGMRILYVSNRVALDIQQKQELAELTHLNRKVFPSDIERVEEITEFSNVTVLTYHKLYHRLLEEDAEAWCKTFKFVVLDECHFFYSDALFYPFTGDILKRIPRMFYDATRIYMSATFDDVFEPIRFYEEFADLSNIRYLRFDSESHRYYFPRDYSNYKTFYFSDIQQIKEKIQEEGPCGAKWIIFVKNKETGLSLCKELNAGEKENSLAEFINAESRTSNDFNIQVLWKQLCATGRFPGKVLITTSVLDNGFSIKDSRVANIVLFTNDKTEFIQELGRCRLQPDQQINVFIKKLDPSGLSYLQQEYKQYKDIILSFCGDKDTAPLEDCETYYTLGDPVKTFQRLWSPGSNPCRGFIYPAETKDHKIYPKINMMARWRTKLLGEEIEKYEALYKENKETAPVLCKENWLGGEGGTEYTRYAKERDLDIEASQLALDKLKELLEEQAVSGQKLIEKEEAFETFSKQFVELYRAAYKGDKSFNSSRVSKEGVGVRSINNHLKKMFDDGIYFEFVPVTGAHTKAWVLQGA